MRRLFFRPAAWAPVATAMVAAALLPGEAAAQSDLRREILESQRRLEEIRAEREQLQREMERLRSRVRDVSQELRNIERQLSASRSVLAEVDFQVEATTSRIQETQADLMRSREELRERSAVLYRRLRDIYKRGPLSTARVLLSAESFSDLLNRYRYLSLIALYDRTLVRRVERLESELVSQNQELRETLAELGRLRRNRLGELAELRQVEDERRRTLETFRSREERTETRLAQLEEDEERLTGLLEELERRRRAEEQRRRVAGRGEAGPGSLSTRAMGSLDWPVEGEVIYRFGRDRRPDGTVLRWNGVGIAAPPGTPVRAVRPGRVVLAGPFEGYGPTVVLSHGDGFYTLYLYLEDVGVVEGREVVTGQVVGTVGGSETPEGPHLEFQVRVPVEGGAPQAMDPLQWLRSPDGP